MHSKQRPHANQKKVEFYSIFEETVPHVAYFWHQVENSNYPESQLTIFQGKLLNKNFDNDRWEASLFEMQPDRLFKKPLNGESELLECCYLHGCFLKKFNHYDSQYPNYKYGFRLQMGPHLSFFVTDSAEQYKKWFFMLRRFCILEKFKRKYKVIAQLKYNDPIFGQVCYNCVRISDAGYLLITQNQKLIFFKELQNLRRLNHPQLMRLIETYEDDNNIYEIFDQYMGSDLRQHLRETQLACSQGDLQTIDERLLADLMCQLITAVQHMHSKGVFHRDIKLDNLFVPENNRLPFVLLSNFCYSENFKLSGQTNPQGFKKCGTPGYVAPEIFKTKHYDQKIDIFSMGVVFYILVYGKMPFEGKDQEEILRANEKGDIDFKAEKRLCKKISTSGIELMKNMLNKDPIKRFNANQVMNHHWFIKMKAKDEQNQNGQQLGRMRSLSTIVENSEIMELTNRQQFTNYQKKSFINPRPSRNSSRNNALNYSKNNLAPNQSFTRHHQSHDTFVDRIEKEFSQDTLDQKMSLINQQQLPAPSRKRHASNFEKQ